MYTVPPARAWWPAVGAPLERGVRHPSGYYAKNSTLVLSHLRVHVKAFVAGDLTLKMRVGNDFRVAGEGD